ncbi:MAG: DUF1993 family protein [Rickettsiales bacterium]
MTLSMYQASIPGFILGFTNLSALLDKAAVFCEEKKIEQTVLVNARLAPDMLPLSRQVQIASDIVRRGIARIAGVEAPGIDDKETTFAELKARIDTTIAYLKSFKPAQIDGTEGNKVSLKVGGHDLSFTAQDYLLKFVMPNLYFHETIAYAILRHNGVAIGKMDFLGNIQ